MKFDKLIEVVTKAFPRVKLGGKKDDPKLAALDRGVLTVALLLAALDGTILPEEFAAFRSLAKSCRGGSAKNVRALLDAALPAAGQLMMMAQTGVYSEKERLAAFLAAAAKALPDGFVDGSLADLRRAFVLWVTVGVADGKFSTAEKEAVSALEWHYAAVRAHRTAAALSGSNGRPSSPAREGTGSTGISSFRLLEPDFLARAEKAASDLAVPAKRAKAEAVLDELIAKVEIVDGAGEKSIRSASQIAVNLATMAIIGFMTAVTK